MTTPRDLPPYTTAYYPKIYLKSQLCTKPQWPSKDTNLIKKVAIVTGANSGMGFESSHQLLSHNLSYLIIAAFVQRIEGQLSRLDIIIILIAGLGNLKFAVVPSTGHEEVMQVNYFSTVLLCILLLPVLKGKAATISPGRLTSYDNPKTFDWNEQYSASKLLAHMFLWKLVDYVSTDDVVVNLIDPGLVKGTDLQREASGKGASTYLDAALVKGKESHGCYIMNWQFRPFATFLYTTEGKQIIESLWSETMAELKFADGQGTLEFMRRA
ncbi:hypothetical protein BDV29DRAFT_161945 [Aspergillus leporis]|uniref:NAD(P)-binding protein n=1 Tax=Aspergillus leporis TaxID=41062 RepID=A0A5N5WK50_9EURO|nr:hypothetical protein BDV29DRAFT_161945 [Aspergillus leporis]